MVGDVVGDKVRPAHLVGQSIKIDFEEQLNKAQNFGSRGLVVVAATGDSVTPTHLMGHSLISTVVAHSMFWQYAGSTGASVTTCDDNDDDDDVAAAVVSATLLSPDPEPSISAVVSSSVVGVVGLVVLAALVVIAMLDCVGVAVDTVGEGVGKLVGVDVGESVLAVGG